MTEASLSPNYPEDNFILFRYRSFQAKNPFNIAKIHSYEYMGKNFITPLNSSAYRDYLCPKKPHIILSYKSEGHQNSAAISFYSISLRLAIQIAG